MTTPAAGSYRLDRSSPRTWIRLASSSPATVCPTPLRIPGLDPTLIEGHDPMIRLAGRTPDFDVPTLLVLDNVPSNRDTARLVAAAGPEPNAWGSGRRRTAQRLSGWASASAPWS